MHLHARRAGRQAQQGAAMVEFAITLLALIPLLLYAIFLSDVSYHQLEVQETVVSTTWDFAVRNHEPRGSDADQNRRDEADHVSQLDRLEYADHTSSFDDGAEGSNDNDYSILSGHNDNHHNQFAARACWFGNNGNADSTSTTYDNDESTQVVCEVNKDDDLEWMGLGLGLSSLQPAAGFGKGKYNKGGLAKCWAKAWVYNFLVPEQFLQGDTALAHTDLSQKKLRSGDTYDVKGEGGTANNIMVKDRAAISFDTWAIVNGAKDDKIEHADINTDTDSDNPFYQRAKEVYKGTGVLTQVTWALVMARSVQYIAQARSDGVMNILPNVLDGPFMLTAMEPASPLSFFLTARYKNPDVSDGIGYKQQCPPTLRFGSTSINLDIGCQFGGPKWQSTTWDLNSKVPQAYDKRTKHYMGCTDPYKC